jgi:hypothetical protein
LVILSWGDFIGSVKDQQLIQSLLLLIGYRRFFASFDLADRQLNPVRPKGGYDDSVGVFGDDGAGDTVAVAQIQQISIRAPQVCRQRPKPERPSQSGELE